MKKYSEIFLIFLCIASLFAAGCTSETAETVLTATPTTAIVTTMTQTSTEMITQIPQTTINPACDLSGSCVDLSRRMEESLHDCSIYGRNDPRCLSITGEPVNLSTVTGKNPCKISQLQYVSACLYVIFRQVITSTSVI